MSASMWRASIAVVVCAVLAACREPSEAATKDAVLAVNGHVTILHRTDPLFSDHRDVSRRALEVQGVTSAERVLFAEASIAGKAGSTFPSILFKGASAATTKASLGRYMTSGAVPADASPGPAQVVLGRALAATLGVGIGDDVVVTLRPATVSRGEQGPPPAALRLRVVGMFRIDDKRIAYDPGLAYTTVAAMEPFAGKGDTTISIEVRVRDPERAAELAATLIERLGPDYHVVDWYELNRELFESMASTKRSP